MKCVMCENEKNLKKESIKMKYKECGLDNVVLDGVDHFRCDKCGEEFFGFGDQEQLHAIIAETLIKDKKDLLSGKEIRFLRSYLGYSGAVFAKLIGYSKEALSRIENHKSTVTLTFDRLIRSMVASRLPNRDYNLYDMWLKHQGKKLTQICLTQKNGWHLQEAA